MRLFSIFLNIIISFSFLKSATEASTEHFNCTGRTIPWFRVDFGLEEGFAAGTVVATSKGYKLIENITKDDLVIDPKGEAKKVLKVATKNVSCVICSVIDDEKIYAGCDQLFNISGAWCNARDLKNHGIETYFLKENIKLYQLTVEDHIFSVEKSNIIVHNVDAVVAPLVVFFTYSNPVAAVIGATVGFSAMAYAAYTFYQAQQIASLARIATLQKEKELTHEVTIHERGVATKNIAHGEKDLAINQEAENNHEHVKQASQLYQSFLERRAKRLEKYIKQASASSEGVASSPDPLKPEDEEAEKKRKEEEEFKKKHPNGRYHDVDYHKNYQSGRKSPRPLDGQKALDNSFEVPGRKGMGKRRIAISNGQFVVLTETMEGLYHGHVRTWGSLRIEMQKVLLEQGLVKNTGKIIKCK